MAHVALNVGSGSNANDVGRGHIFDASGLSTSPGGTNSGLPAWSSSTSMPSASQYRLPPSEVLKGLANRFVHSTSYIYLYGSMALASFLTVVLSLVSECPGTTFYVIEMIVNTVLVLEVGVRFVAFGRQFWHSTFNILDLFLVFLCTLTLLIIFFSHGCSPYNRGTDRTGNRGGRQGKGEELLDSFLLIFRNGMQLIRLLAVVRRSGRNALSRPRGIDLDPSALVGGGGSSGRGASAARSGSRPGGGGGASGPGGPNDFSLDIDLEDDAEAHRSRMRDGGDWTARSGGPKGSRLHDERRELMHDYDDDDEL